ncbi:hypothetical protein [Nocardia sp. NPDC057440]|uniref:hypothetical protein n=1 Tax=Nocardia sp. NPDC057440 TaxID=3346134 RepID=UPI0036717072
MMLEDHADRLAQLRALKAETIAKFNQATPGVAPQFAKVIADLSREIAELEAPVLRGRTPLEEARERIAAKQRDALHPDS